MSGSRPRDPGPQVGPSSGAFPELTGDSRAAVEYRGGHLQIIASAGSGKTEVVAQRVVSLLAEGVAPGAIIAFTFTERAAAELKSRIEERAAAAMDPSVLDHFNAMFVGTIHAYCFRLLQQHVAKFETFDVLDDHRLAAFLTRYGRYLDLQGALGGRFFEAVRVFRDNVQVVENELVEADRLEEPFKRVYEDYLALLDDHRFLTYGQQIARAVDALNDPVVFEAVQSKLQHLIVDEYQDINPAQEALIARLASPPVHLCVVGDDDQAIYQWRGSDVSNIVSFTDRYQGAQRFTLSVNRRSVPAVVTAANQFATSITGRLPKDMAPHRPASGTKEVVCWMTDTESDQADLIASTVRRFHDELGYPYRDLAILCRGRSSFTALLDALESQHIPVQPGSRTLLFATPEADLFGRTMSWLIDHDWRAGHTQWAQPQQVDFDDLLRRYEDLYDLGPDAKARTANYLTAWKATVPQEERAANLVGSYYELLECLGVDEWDLSDPWFASRLGTLARCSQVLVDYESTRRRSRPDPDDAARMRGGRDRGEWYFRLLAIFLVNWARGAYEGFDGEDQVDIDAVDLTTIHQSKGLEWPVVFVPSLTSQRFPSKMVGTRGKWHLPPGTFDPVRYEGTKNDERRLFYVAMTRARDFLSLSSFERINNRTPPSPFLKEVAGGVPDRATELPSPPGPSAQPALATTIEISFSDLATYAECGLSYRLRRLLGFQPPLVAEIGYGKAVHHLMRHLAEFVQGQSRHPTDDEIEAMLQNEFYLPSANWAAYQGMRARAGEVVREYLTQYPDELAKVWEVERPFELHLGDVTIFGRADVVIDTTAGAHQELQIIDYKTAVGADGAFDLQLQVYADAGSREGLDIVSAQVHDLASGARQPVDVGPAAISAAEDRVRVLVDDLRAGNFAPTPGPACAHCDVRPICQHRQ